MRRDAVGQIALALAAAETYELLRRLIAPDWPLAISHARAIEALEGRLHVAWEAPLQRPFLAHPDVLRVLDGFYFAGHFVVTAVFLVWLYRRSRPAYARFRNALIATTAIAFTVQWRFPAAPPRAAGLGLADTVRRYLGLDLGSPHSRAITDPVAAMPSLHAGWALAVGLGVVVHARNRAVRVAGALYPPAVIATTIVTGNHFVLDAVAGMLVLGLGFLVTQPSARNGVAPAVLKSALRRGVEQSGSSPGS